MCVCVCFLVLCKWRRNTHHLRVVGIESLLVQGELLRTEGVVEFNHLRKLQAETSVTVRHRYLSSRGRERLERSYTCVQNQRASCMITNLEFNMGLSRHGAALPFQVLIKMWPGTVRPNSWLWESEHPCPRRKKKKVIFRAAGALHFRSYLMSRCCNVPFLVDLLPLTCLAYLS